MLIRDTFLNTRLNEDERRLFEAVAERLERNGSDLVRYLLREKARELGILPQPTKRMVKDPDYQYS